jgi:hypothetical protein
MSILFKQAFVTVDKTLVLLQAVEDCFDVHLVSIREDRFFGKTNQPECATGCTLNILLRLEFSASFPTMGVIVSEDRALRERNPSAVDDAETQGPDT